LSHLTAIKQKHNDPIADYIRRFRDIRNRCFNLIIFDKDLADLAYLGLLSHLREKLKSHVFSDVIVKAEPTYLGVSLGAVIRLEMIVPSTWSDMLVNHRMTGKSTCA
jgi:vancomycin permeability regulator SanA